MFSRIYGQNSIFGTGGYMKWHFIAVFTQNYYWSDEKTDKYVFSNVFIDLELYLVVDIKFNIFRWLALHETVIIVQAANANCH